MVLQIEGNVSISHLELEIPLTMKWDVMRCVLNSIIQRNVKVIVNELATGTLNFKTSSIFCKFYLYAKLIIRCCFDEKLLGFKNKKVSLRNALRLSTNNF